MSACRAQGLGFQGFEVQSPATFGTSPWQRAVHRGIHPERLQPPSSNKRGVPRQTTVQCEGGCMGFHVSLGKAHILVKKALCLFGGRGGFRRRLPLCMYDLR